jgi:hypothetical protein
MKTTSKMAIAAAALIAVGALGTTAFAHRQGGGYGGGHHGGGHGGGYHGGGRDSGGYGRGHHRGWKGHGKRHHARQMMERYDANNDRKVTQEEINTNREAWHKEFDANNDGKLSLDEFKQLFLKARAQRIVRQFQRFDRDGDAGVTPAEYLRPLENMVEMRDRNGDGALSREDMRRRHKSRDRMMRRDGGREDAEETEAAPEGESSN